MVQRRAGSGLPPWLTWVIVVALAAVVFALVVASLRLGDARAEQPERTPADVATQLPDPEPVPSEAPAPPPALVPSLASLALADDTVLWRAGAGTCTVDAASGAPPALERSGDGLAFASVAPAGIDVREVLWLQAINAATVEAVVLVGPECEAQVLRTFTSGNFWQVYPSSITGAAVVDQVAGVLRTPAAELTLPCAAPAKAITGAPATAPVVLCAGQVAWWVSGAWQLVELTNVVSASFDAATGEVVTARESVAECDGVLLERWSAPGQQTATSCTPGAGVLAVQAAGSTVWIWSEAGVETVSLNA